MDTTEFLKLLSKWVQRIYLAVQSLWKKKTGRECTSWRIANSREWGGLCMHMHLFLGLYTHTHTRVIRGQQVLHII